MSTIRQIHIIHKELIVTDTYTKKGPMYVIGNPKQFLQNASNQYYVEGNNRHATHTK